MPFISVAGHGCHYRCEGLAGAPVLILSHALGASLGMWDEQLALGERLRLLRYDTRGQGRSEATPGPYSVEQLGSDVLALADALGLERFSFCGLSMGGLIGQWLGLNAPERLDRLLLCATARRFGTAQSWAERIGTVEQQGMAAMTESTLGRWFTPDFSRRAPQTVQRIRESLLSCDPRGYAANCAAVSAADFTGGLSGIAVPTLVLSGTQDAGASLDEGKALAAGIPGARFAALPAAHLLNIEAAQDFNEAVSVFLT